MKNTLSARVSICLSICVLSIFIITLVVYFTTKNEYFGGLSVLIPLGVLLALLAANIITFIVHVFITIKNKAALSRLALVFLALTLCVLVLGQITVRMIDGLENKEELLRPIPKAQSLN